jgi:hypothetical protein
MDFEEEVGLLSAVGGAIDCDIFAIEKLRIRKDLEDREASYH